MLAKALAIAAEAHREQRDKQGVPYILHPFRVVEALRQEKWSETHQTVAALHDVVEDTEITLEEIHEKFGNLVGDAVDALTRRGHYQMTPDKVWVWEETYKEYIVRCCHNNIARVVKRFDVYDNSDPKRYVNSSLVKRYTWTLEYLQSLAAIDLARAEEGVFS